MKGEDMTTEVKTQPTADHEEAGPSDSARRAASDDSAQSQAADQSTGKRPQISVSMSLRGLLLGLLAVLLVAVSATMTYLYLDARSELSAQAVQSENDSRAEKMALDYAVAAATMDFKDLQAWKVRLVQGTSEELNAKLTGAANDMEQVLVPLEWSSSAQPLVAKVRSDADGVYIVDSFVSVQTKTIQSPEPLQSTATYSTTIDSNNNWQITDVGGLTSALEPK